MAWRQGANGRVRAALGAAVVLAVLMAATFAPPAQSYVYWGNSEVNVTSIGRAELDGSGVNQSFIGMGGVGQGPYFLAVDASHIYWGTASSIGRANLDGSNPDPRFILMQDAVGVAVDASHIYWTSVVDDSRIGRANLDGTGVDSSFITGVTADGALAVDGHHIYWADADNQHTQRSIGRADLDGTGVDQTFIDVGTDYPWGVAVDAEHVYWLCAGGVPFVSRICRANIDGTGLQEGFITAVVNPTALAVDGEHIYWVDAATGSIGRANLDGTGVDPSFITGLQGGFGLAVDAGRMSPPPMVTGISPQFGAEAGGTSVTISGTDLAGAIAVRFGSADAASYTVDSPTSVTATAPPGTGTVDVTVATLGGTSATSPADQFTYVSPGPPPSVRKLSPQKGPPAGDTVVTISGAGFDGVTSVDFGAVSAASFTVTGNDSVTAVAPPGSGTVDVTVTTPNGTSAISPQDRFKYK